MYSELYTRSNYLLNIPYVNSSYITEYDLSKANISALKYVGYLSDDDYNRLYFADKMYREIYIGKLEKQDSTVTELKKKGITEARRLFFEANDLQDKDILSIKNDAIFVIGSRVRTNTFGILDFKKKNTYTFFMHTSGHLEIYYLYNQLTGEEVFDVKGINDTTLELHKDFMIQFLCQIFYLIQTNTIEYTIGYFNDFYNDFVNLRLDCGYYREFNSDSMFKIYRPNSSFSSFYLPFIDEATLHHMNNDRSVIDVQTNIALLRDVYSVLADIYFNKKR